MTRGLGDILDGFMRGKIVESGVVNILRKFNSKKDYHLDFEVHKITDSDPDIVKIQENQKNAFPLC